MSKITKRALAASLKKMMEERPLGKITVTDIAKDCGINRHTFYYHFKDIYDLVEWIYLSETESALSETKIADNWETGMKKLFSYALANKKFIIGTYCSLSKEHLRKFLHEHVFLLINAVMEEKTQDINIAPEKREFAVNFYTYAFCGIVLAWIEKDMKEDPEKLVSLLSTMMQGENRETLRRLEEK